MWYSTVGGIVMLLLSLLAAPHATDAQPPGKVTRLGFLRFGPASVFADRVEALRTGLRALGYVEGQNLVMEFRWAATVDQLSAMAAELVRMPVDLIFAMSSTEVEAARQPPRRSPLCSRPMPTPSVSGTWRAWRSPAATSRGCRALHRDRDQGTRAHDPGPAAHDAGRRAVGGDGALAPSGGGRP